MLQNFHGNNDFDISSLDSPTDTGEEPPTKKSKLSESFPGDNSTKAHLRRTSDETSRKLNGGTKIMVWN